MIRCIICQKPKISEIRHQHGFATCPTCEANIKGWERRPTGDVIKRKHDLAMYTERMSMVKATRNVTSIRAKRRVAK